MKWWDKWLHYVPWRTHIRWRWTLMVGLVMAVTVSVLMSVLLDIEREAWLDNQERQAEISVNRLSEAVKLPLLSGSRAEVDVIVRGFMTTEPAVLGVSVLHAHGAKQWFGAISKADRSLVEKAAAQDQVLRLPSEHLWFAKHVQYAHTPVGVVAVRYSQQAWADLSQRMLNRMLWAALIAVVLSGGLVFWVVGRISQPMEALAGAAEKVAEGDYQVQLPAKGSDEVAEAMQQFNRMVNELAHKEKMRDAFGKYLNPKLVSEVFEHGSAKMENRRQEVTVMFADMVGFTSFSEDSEPEYVVDVLNKHFEVFHRIIDSFSGHVDKYIGDAVMAVFNHPRERSDHVTLSVLAALAMVEACDYLGVLRQNGEKISFRVGLNCGDAIVGSIGANERLEYTVIGDTVNIASRMTGLGDGGEVVVSYDTFERLDGRFEFETLGMKKVKGVKEMLECGRVVIVDDGLKQEVRSAISLALDVTLSVHMRQKIGNVL